jgi:PTS system mannitol-specific IIC component
MQPSLILAAIAGGASGVFTFQMTGAGLVAAASPGSIFAVSAMAPKGSLLPVFAGVIVATVVSFLVAAVLIKKKGETNDDALTAAQDEMISLKGKNSSVVKGSVKKIIVACDAGMGSSAMGASKLKSKIKKAGLDIEVANASIDSIPADTDIVITHNQLTERAKASAPNATHISLDDFIMTDVYDKLVEQLKK